MQASSKECDTDAAALLLPAMQVFFNG